MSANNSKRLVSLAAGVVQEFAPDEVVYAAAEAGFNAVGVWCDLSTWTEATTNKVKAALDKTKLVALDIEVVWFHPGEAIDTHDRVVQIAKAIGARNILCVSSEPDINQTKERFKHLCQQVEGTDIKVVLEFLAITKINTLGKALDVANSVAHPNGGILIDALHLQRTGAGVSDIHNIMASNPALLPYLQLCDGASSLEDTSFEGMINDAVHLRQLLGEGALPLQEILSAIDDQLPISLEIRSKALNEQFPDLIERAKAVYENAVKYLA